MIRKDDSSSVHYQRKQFGIVLLVIVCQWSNHSSDEWDETMEKYARVRLEDQWLGKKTDTQPHSNIGPNNAFLIDSNRLIYLKKHTDHRCEIESIFHQTEWNWLNFGCVVCFCQLRNRLSYFTLKHYNCANLNWSNSHSISFWGNEIAFLFTINAIPHRHCYGAFNALNQNIPPITEVDWWQCSDSTMIRVGQFQLWKIGDGILAAEYQDE